jgi:hypothetical protein
MTRHTYNVFFVAQPRGRIIGIYRAGDAIFSQIALNLVLYVCFPVFSMRYIGAVGHRFTPFAIPRTVAQSLAVPVIALNARLCCGGAHGLKKFTHQVNLIKHLI